MNLRFQVTSHTESLDVGPDGKPVTLHNVTLNVAPEGVDGSDFVDTPQATLHLSNLSDAGFQGLQLRSVHTLASLTTAAPVAPAAKPAPTQTPQPASPIAPGITPTPTK